MAQQIGFTLIELLVVISIIAILGGMLLPALVCAKGCAQIRRAQAEINLLASAFEVMSRPTATCRYPPPLRPAVTAKSDFTYGTSGAPWLYLHTPSDDPKRAAAVEKTCFVYNRKAPIDARDVERYRPKPPPIAKNHATETALTKEPARYRWVLEWSTAGEAVLLRRDGQPWCLVEVNRASKHGYCRSIKAEGPWGSPWDQQKFDDFQWADNKGEPDQRSLGPARR